jgi:hypothetical protein
MSSSMRRRSWIARRGWLASVGAFGVLAVASCTSGSSDDRLDGSTPGVDSGNDARGDASGGDATSDTSQHDAMDEDAPGADGSSDDASDDATVDAPAEGASDAPPDTLGSSCTSNSDCQSGEYCEQGDNKTYQKSNNHCSATGVCTLIPPPCNPNCASNGDTFCACDGKTYYCIDCVHSAGTDVAWINMQGLNPCP